MDWPLFFSALLSATLLPGGSEAMLLLKLQGGEEPMRLVAIATLGNLLGSVLTYLLGRVGNHALHQHWLRLSDADLERAETWFGRWGTPSLLLAWLPVVGDPLCFAAGLLRTGWLRFILLVGIGKFARYLVLAGLLA